MNNTNTLFFSLMKKNSNYTIELKMFTNINLVRVYHSTSCNKN